LPASFGATFSMLAIDRSTPTFTLNPNITGAARGAMAELNRIEQVIFVVSSPVQAGNASMPVFGAIGVTVMSEEDPPRVFTSAAATGLISAWIWIVAPAAIGAEPSLDTA